MRNYRDLHVYHKAHHVAVRAHAICSRISSRRYPGLASQLRRATASVGANIVEGTAHSSRHEFARFLQLALASNVEADHHLQFARDVDAIDAAAHAELATANQEVRRMLASLVRRVRDELSEAEAEATSTAAQTTDADATIPKGASISVRERGTGESMQLRRHGRPDTS